MELFQILLNLPRVFRVCDAIHARGIFPQIPGIPQCIDFGAESSRPAFSLSTLLFPTVTRRNARLATGLPAAALAGLDFHQLDSFERFHPLTGIPPKLCLARYLAYPQSIPFPAPIWRPSSPRGVAHRGRAAPGNLTPRRSQIRA